MIDLFKCLGGLPHLRKRFSDTLLLGWLPVEAFMSITNTRGHSSLVKGSRIRFLNVGLNSLTSTFFYPLNISLIVRFWTLHLIRTTVWVRHLRATIRLGRFVIKMTNPGSKLLYISIKLALFVARPGSLTLFLSNAIKWWANAIWISLFAEPFWTITASVMTLLK